VKTVAELIGAMGMKHCSDLKPWHIIRRTVFSNSSELFKFMEEGSFLGTVFPDDFKRLMESTSADTFASV